LEFLDSANQIAPMKVKEEQTLLSLKNVNHETLKKYFNFTFDRYTNFFKTILKRDLTPTNDGTTKLTKGPDRAYYFRAEKLRHPLVFYLGHTAVFYINKLITANLLKEEDRLDPWVESICAVGVDEMSWDDKLIEIEACCDSKEDDKKIGTNAWPTIDRVYKYRDHLKEKMNQIIENFDLSDYIPEEAHKHKVWAILMGIEHEGIHLTTSCPIIRQLPLEMVNKVEEFKIAPFLHKIDSLEDLDKWVNHEGGPLTVGAEWSKIPEYMNDSNTYYQWDIETGHSSFMVKPFQIRKYSVTNGEYLEFVSSGDYKKPEYWPKESLNWNEKHSCPRFWRFDEDSKTWKLRLLDREIPLPLFWPVEVNHHESMAYIHWYNQKNNMECRLLTEIEYYSLIQREKKTPIVDLIKNSNINFKYQSCSPVDMFESPSGICDLIGNLWSHTMTSQYAYSDYSTHSYYEDFSLPFLDEKHIFIKGGCFTSTGTEMLPMQRSAFRKHFYQFCGIKLVVGDIPQENENSRQSREKNPKLATIIHSHYKLDENNSPLNCPNFYESIAKQVVSLVQKNENLKEMRVLDLGCQVGRLSFELAKEFKFVLGIDIINLIKFAHEIRETNKLCYLLKNGDLENVFNVNYDAKPLQNTQFIQFEFSNIPKTHVDAFGKSLDMSHFHVITCVNLLERVREPVEVLRQIDQLQQSGDYLFLSSTYSWDENVTKKEFWIECKYIDAEKVEPLKIIQKILKNYKLIEVKNICSIERKTLRNFDLKNSEFSIWRKF
jgi:5-histidylcysteine sulfoxide synthase